MEKKKLTMISQNTKDIRKVLGLTVLNVEGKNNLLTITSIKMMKLSHIKRRNKWDLIDT